ncbi:MAG: glycine cleavage system protein H [Gemmatimonadota bacterium]|nr:MAG: glycine cleavage system protein H [Gemmatimonadota bacterium]
MSVVLAIATCALCLLVAGYVRRRRARVAEAARHAVYIVGDVSSTEPVTDVLFHSGHTWVRVHHDNLVSIGSTEFASNLAGSLETIAVPPESRSLRQGLPAWTLVARNGRELTQRMPIDGKVLAINREALHDPGVIQRSPYHQGWILRVRPRDIHRALLNLLPAPAERLWLETAFARVSAQLSSSLKHMFRDRMWAPRFGDWLRDAEWEVLKCELFPSS